MYSSVIEVILISMLQYAYQVPWYTQRCLCLNYVLYSTVNCAVLCSVYIIYITITQNVLGFCKFLDALVIWQLSQTALFY
jgi:hypothetical protein